LLYRGLYVTFGRSLENSVAFGRRFFYSFYVFPLLFPLVKKKKEAAQVGQPLNSWSFFLGNLVLSESTP